MWGFELEQDWSTGAPRIACSSPKFTLGRATNWSTIFDVPVCLAQERRKLKIFFLWREGMREGMREGKKTRDMPQRGHKQSINHPWSVQARAKAAEKKQREEREKKDNLHEQT